MISVIYFHTYFFNSFQFFLYYCTKNYLSTFGYFNSLQRFDIEWRSISKSTWNMLLFTCKIDIRKNVPTASSCGFKMVYFPISCQELFRQIFVSSFFQTCRFEVCRVGSVEVRYFHGTHTSEVWLIVIIIMIRSTI